MKWIEELIPTADKSWHENHHKLCDLIKNYIQNPEYGIEIGVAFGSNSFNLLNNFNTLKLYSIDPYVRYSNEDKMSDLVENEKGDQLYSFVSNRLRSKFGDRSFFIRGTSEAVKDFKNESFDFIYIDGDHTYEGVKKDLNNTFLKVKKNGIFCGDDYGIFEDINFNVKKAVDEFCTNNNLTLNLSGSFWWLIK
jgi:predicted O-methyltransferase YrrM